MANNDRDQKKMHTARSESEQSNDDLHQESGGAEKDPTKGRESGSGQATPGKKVGNQMTGSGTYGISEDDEDLGGRAGQSGSQAGSTPRSGNSGS